MGLKCAKRGNGNYKLFELFANIAENAMGLGISAA